MKYIRMLSMKVNTTVLPQYKACWTELYILDGFSKGIFYDWMAPWVWGYETRVTGSNLKVSD